MKESSGAVKLPAREESIAPVTILDGQGRVVRVVPAAEFRRSRPLAPAAWRERGRHKSPTQG